MRAADKRIIHRVDVGCTWLLLSWTTAAAAVLLEWFYISHYVVCLVFAHYPVTLLQYNPALCWRHLFYIELICSFSFSSQAFTMSVCSISWLSYWSCVFYSKVMCLRKDHTLFQNFRIWTCFCAEMRLSDFQRHYLRIFLTLTKGIFLTLNLTVTLTVTLTEFLIEKKKK